MALDQHHLDKGEVKAYRLVDLVDVRNRAVECKWLFGVFIAAGATSLIVLSVEAK